MWDLGQNFLTAPSQPFFSSAAIFLSLLTLVNEYALTLFYFFFPNFVVFIVFQDDSLMSQILFSSFVFWKVLGIMFWGFFESTGNKCYFNNTFMIIYNQLASESQRLKLVSC